MRSKERRPFASVDFQASLQLAWAGIFAVMLVIMALVTTIMTGPLLGLFRKHENLLPDSANRPLYS